jgi:hypothetical protein
MAETGKTKKKSMGSLRSKIGGVAKAGRRRPPHIKSEIDFYGKRQWTAGVQTKLNQAKSH